MLILVAFDREKINEPTFLRPFCDSVNFCLTTWSKTIKKLRFSLQSERWDFWAFWCHFWIQGFFEKFWIFEIFFWIFWSKIFWKFFWEFLTRGLISILWKWASLYGCGVKNTLKSVKIDFDENLCLGLICRIKSFYKVSEQLEQV